MLTQFSCTKLERALWLWMLVSSSQILIRRHLPQHIINCLVEKTLFFFSNKKTFSNILLFVLFYTFFIPEVLMPLLFLMYCLDLQSLQKRLKRRQRKKETRPSGGAHQPQATVIISARLGGIPSKGSLLPARTNSVTSKMVSGDHEKRNANSTWYQIHNKDLCQTKRYKIRHQNWEKKKQSQKKY